jgi:transcriptional regulator with XRE-family HTH domain
MSIAKFCDLLQCDKDRLRSASLSAKLKDRPIFHPALSQLLSSARQGRGWSIRQARIQAAGKGFDVTDNQLRWLEQGKTKAPEQALLRAAAAIYSFDYVELAKRIVVANYGLDVIAGERASDVPSSPDITPAPARTPRAGSVARHLARARQLLEEMSDAGVRKAVDYLELVAAANPRDEHREQTMLRASTNAVKGRR